MCVCVCVTDDPVASDGWPRDSLIPVNPINRAARRAIFHGFFPRSANHPLSRHILFASNIPPHKSPWNFLICPISSEVPPAAPHPMVFRFRNPSFRTRCCFGAFQTWKFLTPAIKIFIFFYFYRHISRCEPYASVGNKTILVFIFISSDIINNIIV